MDLPLIGTVVAILVGVATFVLHLLGILERLAAWFRKAWRALRSSAPAAHVTRNTRLPPRTVRYEPEWHFALLPQHFMVDFGAQFPYIEVTFFAVSFLPRPIQLTEVDLSLQLSGMATIEDIPFRQKDWQVDPKTIDVVFCRRNLTDLERTKLPWQTGRLMGAYQLSAKATDGEQKFSYGPVSSKYIEGWVNLPTQR